MTDTKTWARVKSPWVLHFNSGACNGCDIEIVALLTPKYDIERFGVKLEPSPRHADVLLVTGCVTQQCAERLKSIYDQMPQPKFVVAIGACACSGGVFEGNYNVVGGVDKVIPVTAYIPGCPPRPEAILDGVVKLLNALNPPKPKKQPKQAKAPEVAKTETVAAQAAQLKLRSKNKLANNKIDMISLIKSKFGEKVQIQLGQLGAAAITANNGLHRDVLQAMIEADEKTGITAITGLDLGVTIGVYYHIHTSNVFVTIKTEVPKENPTIQTIVDLHPGAAFHELEVADLLGVSLRRTPNPWTFRPVRKLA